MGEPNFPTRGGPALAPSWRERLAELELTLAEASRAIVLLRRSLESGDEQTPPDDTTAGENDEETRTSERAAVQSAEETRNAAFERLWERIDHEKLEQRGEAPPDGEASSDVEAPPDGRAPREGKAPRGLDLLPQQYLITIEDRESAVDLVPIHRALVGLAKMEDVSLVSYANGVPVISVRHQGGLEHEQVREAIAVATDRQCELIDQENGRLFIRLSWPEEREDGDDTTAMGSR